MIQGLVVMGILLALTGFWGYTQKQAKETAEAKLETCITQISRQNDAVKVTKEEGDRRVSQATKGVAASAAVTQAAVAEAKRLRDLAGKDAPPPPKDCPAGAAVEQIRKGLR